MLPQQLVFFLQSVLSETLDVKLLVFSLKSGDDILRLMLLATLRYLKYWWYSVKISKIQLQPGMSLNKFLVYAAATILRFLPSFLLISSATC